MTPIPYQVGREESTRTTHRAFHPRLQDHTSAGLPALLLCIPGVATRVGRRGSRRTSETPNGNAKTPALTRSGLKALENRRTSRSIPQALYKEAARLSAPPHVKILCAEETAAYKLSAKTGGGPSARQALGWSSAT